MAKFINKDGIARVRVISPGQGSSAFYKEGQLARDASAFDGGLVFIDHPTKSGRKEQPERSLRDLVGPIVGTPMYEKAGSVGPGLYSDVKVAKHWQPLLEDLGGSIGVSIRAGGSAVMESIDGKKTKVCEKFNPGATFDFVTQAGRGGKMVALQEAADEKVKEFMESAGFVESDGRSEEERFMEWLDEPKGEGDQMELLEAQKLLTEEQGKVTTLTEANETLTTENARLSEALALRDAGDIIATAVNDKKHKLHDVTRTRLIETLTKSAPMKDGKLDEEALTTLVESSIADEVKYIESLSKKTPGITGMGESEGSEDTPEMHEARVSRKAAAYFAENKGTKDECQRMAELFYS